MSKSTLSIFASLLLSTALAAPSAAAGAKHEAHTPGTLPHYVLFDVGTFGGGFSSICGLACRVLNSHGNVVGIDATTIPDPFCPDWCFIGDNVGHAFEWKNGGTNDLGALQYGVSSFGLGLNDKGLVTGISQNGKSDPDTGAFEGRAVIWKGGKIKDLGTLGGTQSAGGPTVNSSGQVTVQSSTSDSSDPYIGVPQANCIWLPSTERDCGGLDFGINALFLPVTTSAHGAVWAKDTGLTDVGTLGGPDSMVIDINDAGQAVGWAYTSYQAGASGVPDTHPFVWDSATKSFTDLGTLGGTFASATLINNNGQVTGTSNLAGDTELRPFIWDKDNGMRDLGSLGGDYGHGDWINNLGDVVGFSRTTPGSIAGHAFFAHNGGMTDLGVIGDDPESEATGINNKGMIVGGDFDRNVGDLRGWISDNGAALVDLNTLVRKPHGLYVVVAHYVNDRGVIAAQALTTKGEEHTVVLVPEKDLDMLAQMNAAVGTASHANESAAAPTHSQVVRMRQPSCAGFGRARPDHCRRG